MQNDKLLLPCPFCGGEAEFVEDFDGFIGIPVYHIKCKDCDCKKSALEDETVIDYWNTRKPMERIINELEEYKDDLSHYMDDDYFYGEYEAYKHAIEIVKGGVDNANRN